MRPFRNNNKRSRYRGNGDRNFKRNGENQSFTNSVSFQRKSPGRNNQNAPKLIEKYTDLAREALSNGDKILSENYLQHADHFIRVMGDKLKEKNININNGLENKEINSDSNSLKETESETKTEI